MLISERMADAISEQIGREYITLIEAEPGWQDLVRKWDFNAALLPSGSRIAKALEKEDGWQVMDKDERMVFLTH